MSPRQVDQAPATALGSDSSTPPIGAAAETDVSADILAEAWREGTATPAVIHVRPELHARLGSPSEFLRPGHPSPISSTPSGTGVPLVVDEEIPLAPGFEVHRVPPDPTPVRDRRSG
jgi:hypothetical protein